MQGSIIRILTAVICTVIAVGTTEHLSSEGDDADYTGTAQISYEAAAKVASLTVETEPETEEPETTAPEVETSDEMSHDWSGAEATMLAKIAMAEAEGEDIVGKALVIKVVLNRVESEKFPDTIEEVIFQANQFSSTIDGGRYWTTEPSDECWEALAMVERGWDGAKGALYFESENNTSTWHQDNLQYLFQHGGHIFYKEVEA